MRYGLPNCLPQTIFTLETSASAPRSSASHTPSALLADQRLAASLMWFSRTVSQSFSRQVSSVVRPTLPSTASSGPHLPSTSWPEAVTVVVSSVARFSGSATFSVPHTSNSQMPVAYWELGWVMVTRT